MTKKLKQKIDFTYFEYRDIINKLKNKYLFAFFNDDNIIFGDKPFILLRHDIDFCLDAALKIAEKDKMLGIKSTFFLMVGTDNYNIFSENGTNKVNKILKCGHKIGLHSICTIYSHKISVDRLRKLCLREAELIEKWFDITIDIVSFHKPNNYILTGDPTISSPKRHTYMKLFTEKIKYYSDSTGIWRYGLPTESKAYKNNESMQIVIHPIWWSEKYLSQYEKLYNAILRRLSNGICK
jgi:hypothetical protein